MYENLNNKRRGSLKNDKKERLDFYLREYLQMLKTRTARPAMPAKIWKQKRQTHISMIHLLLHLLGQHKD